MADKWSTSEVDALISIWGERDIQSQLDGSKRNKDIYTEIAHKLCETGYSRDWKQCRCKIKNLKTAYKKIKDHNDVTGNGRKTFKFFQQLDGILGHRPASVPEVLLDTQAENQGDRDSCFDDTCDNVIDDDNNYEVSCDINAAVDASATSSAASTSTSSYPAVTKDNNGSPKSKPKRNKKSKGEKVIEKAIDSFIHYQSEAEENFRKHEEECWKRELEVEERRRKEDQNHEIRLFQMLGQFIKPGPPSYASPFEYEY